MLHRFDQFTLWRRWMNIFTFTFAIRFTLAQRHLRFVTMFGAILLGHTALYRRCDCRWGILIVRTEVGVLLLTTLWIAMVTWRWLSLFGVWKGLRVPQITLWHNEIAFQCIADANATLWLLRNICGTEKNSELNTMQDQDERCVTYFWCCLCVDKGYSIHYSNSSTKTMNSIVNDCGWFSPQAPAIRNSNQIVSKTGDFLRNTYFVSIDRRL